MRQKRRKLRREWNGKEGRFRQKERDGEQVEVGKSARRDHRSFTEIQEGCVGGAQMIKKNRHSTTQLREAKAEFIPRKEP
jgi:hypothetical protein